MRVADYLNAQKALGRVAFDYLPHAPAFTATKLAKYLQVPGEQVAKCVLLRGPASYFVAVLPATHYVDTERLREALHGPVRIADDREMSEVFRDCEWGVVPGFGGLYGLPTLLEDMIAPEAPLVMETNTHVEAIRLRCSDFERLERPRRLHFARKGGGNPDRRAAAHGNFST
jgi:Ala-tRNA(Pro) deacylase